MIRVKPSEVHTDPGGGSLRRLRMTPPLAPSLRLITLSLCETVSSRMVGFIGGDQLFLV